MTIEPPKANNIKVVISGEHWDEHDRTRLVRAIKADEAWAALADINDLIARKRKYDEVDFDYQRFFAEVSEIVDEMNLTDFWY